MDKTEFLIMQEQDLVTHPERAQLLPVLEVMKEVLKSAPSSTELDPKKTVEGCFKTMKEVAQKKQKNSCYYMSPAESLEIVAQYLDIKEVKKSSANVDLVDFL